MCVLFSHLLFGRFGGFKFAIPVSKSLGVIGVELFFVLSGFLIGGILFRKISRSSGFGSADVLSFWTRRWWRTLPNYLLFLSFYVVIWIVGVKWFPAPPFSELWRYLLFLQNFAPHHRHIGFFPEAWSLAVEEWMYLLLPICISLLMTVRLRMNAQKAAFYTVGGLLLLPFLGKLLTTQGMDWFEIRGTVLYRLDAIGMGILLAYLSVFHQQFFARLRAPWLFWTGLTTGILLFFVLVALTSEPSGQGLNSLVMRAFFLPAIDTAFAFIIVYASTVPTLPKIISVPAYRISLYSYSLYLCHGPSFFIVSLFLGAYFKGGFQLYIVLSLLQIAFAFAIAAALYHLFEHPMTNMRDRISPGRKRTVEVKTI